MSTYLLIHGGWHGAWCWNKVVPLLKKAGHTVVAPDLPGIGRDTTSREERPYERYMPRIYIETLHDRALGPATQKKMYTALPCQKVYLLPTSHSPFLSAPDQLATFLLESGSLFPHPAMR